MPSIHAETVATLARYLRHFPEDRARLALLQKQLGARDDVFVRSNMTGHVTCSAAVVNAAGDKVLLVDHVALRMWLTPGGHHDGRGSLWDAARREVAEETGVDDAVLHPWSLRTGIPLDIDSHGIPARPGKGEGEHVHHDFLFLATARERPDLQPALAEVRCARWAAVDELMHSTDARQRRLQMKLQAVLASHR